MSRPKTIKPDQLRISSFFSQSPNPTSASGSSTGKRQHSPIDLTGDDPEGSQPKRRKVSSDTREILDHHSQGHVGTSVSPQSLGVTEKYRFEPTSPSSGKGKSTTKGVIQSQRKERLRKILDDRNLFRGGDDAALEVAAEHTDDTDREPDEDKEEDDGTANNTSFEDTLAFFMNAKAKPRATQRAKPPSVKKAQEIGPSGLPFTPLELQVCDTYANIIRSLTIRYRFEN